MADLRNPERLKVPLKDKDGYFYPITSYNQIVMPDGTFWNGEANEIGAIFVDRSGATAGVPAPIDADTLGGVKAQQYALKSDVVEQTKEYMTLNDVTEAIQNALSAIQHASGGSF